MGNHYFEIKANIKVIDIPLLDTTQHKDTLKAFVSDLVIQVLSFVAEKEREDNNKRQRAEIESAKAKGKHLGRPKINLESLNEKQKAILKTNILLSLVNILKLMGMWCYLYTEKLTQIYPNGFKGPMNLCIDFYML
ncbi:hypothetical protein [Bacillus sp. S14(2024)]|uniref:hypothetical protein n=1 Tax=Bacillus sp. S14(2024) TaxID=3162884 RepID=UPI003D261189